MKIETFSTERTAPKTRAGRWLIVFFCTFGGLLLLTAAFLWIERARLPAPQFSSNLAFNEKMRWARPHLAAGRCDTLVMGSSMALNNIDGATLAKGGLPQPLNLGAWGFGVMGDRQMLDIVLGLCRPKLVLLPVYYGDFGGASAFDDFNAAMLRDYFHSNAERDFTFYTQNTSLLDIWRDYRKLARYRRVGPSAYTSLKFDDTGGVLFVCENFRIDPARWEGYRKAPVQDSRKEMQALADMAQALRSNGIDFVVAEAPLRAAAREALGEGLTRWRDEAAQITVASGGRFVAAPAEAPDTDFVDFAHLNTCGAQKWTAHLLPTLLQQKAGADAAR